MRLIRRPDGEGQVLPSGCVATIGVFDGVHLGHQQILRRVRDEAARRGLPSLVFTFEPTPGILGAAMSFAGVMGLLGGFFPAVRAARTSPVVAMKG